MSNKKDNQSSSQNGSYRLDWAIAAISGTFMVGSVMGGLLLGVWLDKRFGIDPIGKAIGVILGGVVGTIELIRMLSQATSKRQ